MYVLASPRRSYQQVTQSVLKYMQCIDVGPKHVVFSVPVCVLWCVVSPF